MNTKAFYILKPFIPRQMQILLRRVAIRKRLPSYRACWPIDPDAAKKPDGWQGWPASKEFALVLTHDVDTAKGQDTCPELMKMEKRLGFRSSFNFVPLRYSVSPTLRADLGKEGFEVGVHGLYHDGKYYTSREAYLERSVRINQFLKEWGAVGYRAPSMLHKLDWFHDLDILYDASTFDTDPFEPNPLSAKTIYPFWVPNPDNNDGYVELPYTLPQDFTLFILMKDRHIEVWKKKLDWIAEQGGMALINVHPDYMNFGDGKINYDEYPARYYEEFLYYVQTRYKDRYWHPLPHEMAQWYANQEHLMDDKTFVQFQKAAYK